MDWLQAANTSPLHRAVRQDSLLPERLYFRRLPYGSPFMMDRGIMKECRLYDVEGYLDWQPDTPAVWKALGHRSWWRPAIRTEV